MSLSKSTDLVAKSQVDRVERSYSFYPYTRSEKFTYYCGRGFCYGSAMCGVSIYARFLWKQPYLSDKNIREKDLVVLNTLSKRSVDSRRWHSKGLATNIFIVIPGIMSCYSYDFLDYKQATYGIIGAGILMVNSIYGILAHTYNNIRFSHQINRLQRSRKISAEEKIEPKELVVTDEISEKSSWISFNFTKQNGEIVYVIRNTLYEKLIFTFQSQATANDFLETLNNFDMGYIEYLANNPYQANKLQREFISNRNFENMIHGYRISIK